MEQVIEYFGFVTGVLYLLWEIKQNNLMWVVGILSALAYMVVFAQKGLYAQMSFQVYYLIISIYGLWVWQRSKRIAMEQGSVGPDNPIVYRMVGIKVLLLSLVTAIAVFVALFVFLEKFTGDPMPAMDAVITSLGIVATYWLGKLYLQQWLVWIVANVLSVVLFFSQNLYPTALLYALYAVCALYGFMHWRKKGIRLVHKSLAK